VYHHKSAPVDVNRPGAYLIVCWDQFCLVKPFSNYVGPE